MPRLAPSFITGLRRPLIEFGRSAADFVYPRHCALCADPLPDSAPRQGELCRTCRDLMLKTAGTACHRCGAPVGPHVDPAQGCNFCLRTRFAFDAVLRLGVYADELRTACLRAKGARQEPVAAALAEITAAHRAAQFRETPIDVVVAIPHFWLQRLYRLHNPAETLAGAWAHTLKARKSSHILTKSKWTKPQRSLPAGRRRENVRHAFRVSRPEEIKNANVLLADDIMTTGATAHEAARVLKRAGAKRVIVAVVARAMRFQ